MAFLPPSLDELIARARQVKNEYQKHGTTERDKVADRLEAIANFIADVRQTHPSLAEEDLRDFLIGVWWCCIENTDRKSWFFSPEYQEGRVFNTGSKY